MMTELDAEVARQLVDYDPATGQMKWKPRDRSWFPSDCSYKHFANMYANKTAGGYRPNGYLQIKILQKMFLAHRIAWLIHYGRMPKSDIDHINGIIDDNRIENLREATKSQNQLNAFVVRGSVRHKGVRFSRYHGKYHASATLGGGKQKHLGYFDNPEKAHEAYCRATALACGEFFNPGDPERAQATRHG
jgi:hypothetical protein